MYVLSDLWLHKDFDVMILSQLQDSWLKKETQLLLHRVSWSKMSCMMTGVKKLMQGSRVNSACCVFWFVIAYDFNSLLSRKSFTAEKGNVVDPKGRFFWVSHTIPCILN